MSLNFDFVDRRPPNINLDIPAHDSDDDQFEFHGWEPKSEIISKAENLLGKNFNKNVITEGDGNCYFRALAQVLNADLNSDTFTHDGLRELICEKIDIRLKNPDSSLLSKLLTETKSNFENIDNDIDFETYLANQRKLGTWANETIIQSTPFILNYDLAIVNTSVDKAKNWLEIFPCQIAGAKLLYLGFENSHFQSLIESERELTSDLLFYLPVWSSNNKIINGATCQSFVTLSEVEKVSSNKKTSEQKQKQKQKQKEWNSRRNKNHKCNKCNEYETSHKNNYDKHIKVCERSTDLLHCSSCNFTTYFKLTLRRHVCEKQNNRKIHSCKVCGYKTPYYCRLNEHLAFHNKQTILDLTLTEEEEVSNIQIEFQLECPIEGCQMKLKQIKDVLKHTAHIHPGVTCVEMCAALGIDITDVEDSLSSKRRGGRNPRGNCSICEEKNVEPKHFTVFHNQKDIRLFQCGYCNIFIPYKVEVNEKNVNKINQEYLQQIDLHNCPLAKKDGQFCELCNHFYVSVYLHFSKHHGKKPRKCQKCLKIIMENFKDHFKDCETKN